MKSPDNWHVGVIRDDGSYDVLTSVVGGSTANIGADSIETVIFPLSFPWSDTPELRSAPFRHVESHERNMGSDDYYEAVAEDSAPGESQYWKVSLEYVEYENPLVIELEHTKNITYADWDMNDLLDAISNRF